MQRREGVSNQDLTTRHDWNVPNPKFTVSTVGRPISPAAEWQRTATTPTTQTITATTTTTTTTPPPPPAAAAAAAAAAATTSTTTTTTTPPPPANQGKRGLLGTWKGVERAEQGKITGIALSSKGWNLFAQTSQVTSNKDPQATPTKSN